MKGILDVRVLVRRTEQPLGRYVLACEGDPELLFTENDSNAERLFGSSNEDAYVKDAFHDHVVRGDSAAVNPARTGTKAAARYRVSLEGGRSRVLRLRLSSQISGVDAFGPGFDTVFDERIAESDAFYSRFAAPEASADERAVQRQAFAGLLWNKQFYHYNVQLWLEGDPAFPPPHHRARRS